METKVQQGIIWKIPIGTYVYPMFKTWENKLEIDILWVERVDNEWYFSNKKIIHQSQTLSVKTVLRNKSTAFAWILLDKLFYDYKRDKTVLGFVVDMNQLLRGDMNFK